MTRNGRNASQFDKRRKDLNWRVNDRESEARAGSMRILRRSGIVRIWGELMHYLWLLRVI